MKWVNRFFLLLLAVPVLLVILFWGLKNNFPGDHLADLMEQESATRLGFPIKVSPIELEWQGIRIPEIVLIRKAGWKFLPRGVLFVMEDLVLDGNVDFLHREFGIYNGSVNLFGGNVNFLMQPVNFFNRNFDSLILIWDGRYSVCMVNTYFAWEVSNV